MTEQDTQDTRPAPGGDQSGAAPQGKTLREIADELGIDKSTVFRYCKSASLQPIGATLQRNGAMLYDATAETAIKAHFEESRPRSAMARQNRRNIARNSAENGIATAATLRNDALQHPTEAAADTVGQLQQQLESVTADRDRLRDQLEDATADRETLIKQMNQMRGELIGRESEAKRLVVQLDQLRKTHGEELDKAEAIREQLQSIYTTNTDSLTRQLEAERQAHGAELERIQRQHAAALDQLRQAHREELDRLTGQLETLRAELTEERQHSRATADTLAQLADQAQRLQLAQMQPPAQIPERKPSLWARLFGKRKHDFDMEGGQDHSPD